MFSAVMDRPGFGHICAAIASAVVRSTRCRSAWSSRLRSIYAVTTCSSVNGTFDCCAFAVTTTAIIIRIKIEPLTMSLFTCDLSVHLEIAQRQTLVEFFVLDMKFDVVVAGPGNGQLSNVNSSDFSDPAYSLRCYLRRSLWFCDQSNFGFFNWKS